MTVSKSLCMIPWLHRFTNEQGWHMACCSGTGPANQLRNAEGEALHVNQRLTDEQVLNSPDYKAIRRAMLKGEWPGVCERCRRSEAAGAVSVRHHMNNRFGHWRAALLDRTALDGTIDDPTVRHADIRLGNTCNLTCRMCSPAASRLWIKHFNRVQPEGHCIPESGMAAFRLNWVKRKSAEWLIEQCLPTVESLHFAGGEPLIIPEMVDVLDLCIQSGRASQIDLSYNTNITELPQRVTRLWPQFRSISLVCSVDGVGALNDYIRRPSNWIDIDRNLRLLDQHFDTWRVRSVVCSATVQIYNILQIGELFDYLSSGFRHIDPIPQLVPLYEPAYLSVQHLPDRVKDIARRRLLVERAKAEALDRPDLHFITSQIDTTLAHMDQAGSLKRLMDFMYFSAKSDQEFGDSWQKAAPELAAAFRSATAG